MKESLRSALVSVFVGAAIPMACFGVVAAPFIAFVVWMLRKAKQKAQPHPPPLSVPQFGERKVSVVFPDDPGRLGGRVFFASLTHGEWDKDKDDPKNVGFHYAYPALEQALLANGCIMLNNWLRAGEDTAASRAGFWFNPNAEWRDGCHLTREGSTTLIRDLVAAMGVPPGSSVLVVGDSTTSEHLKRYHDANLAERNNRDTGWYYLRQTPREEFERSLPATVITNAIPGMGMKSEYYGIISQVKSLFVRGAPNEFGGWSDVELEREGDRRQFDYILLIGGWNECPLKSKVGDPVAHMNEVAAEFCDACAARLRLD